MILKSNKNAICFIPQFAELILANSGASIPSIDFFFSRARHHKVSELEIDQALIQSNNLSQSQLIDSHAALSLRGFTEQYKEKWICHATPILLQPNRQHITLNNYFPSGDDVLFKKLFTTLNEYFVEDGLLFFEENKSWYCRSESKFPTSRYKPQDILGQNIIHKLPKDKEDQKWKKIFNETQMVINQFNQASTNTELLVVNGIWYWGGGYLPQGITKAKNVVISNDIALKGFANMAGCPFYNIDEDINQLIINSSDSFLLQLIFIVNNNILNQIDNIVESFLQMLKRKKIDQILFYPNMESRYVVGSSDMKKFWKKIKPANSIIKRASI